MAIFKYSAVFLLAILATLNSILWSMPWLALIFLICLLLTKASLKMQFSPSSISGITYLWFIFFAIYVSGFSYDASFVKDQYLVTPAERQLVELFCIFLYVFLFLVFKNNTNGLYERYIALFALYVLLLHTILVLIGIETIDNPQYYSYLMFVFLPILLFKDRGDLSLKIPVGASVFILVQLYFGNRFPALAGVMFLIAWWWYPIVHKHSLSFKLTILLYFVMLMLAPLLYVFVMNLDALDVLNSSFSNETNSAFDKGLDGRMIIWPDLLEKITENLFFGTCSNCSSEYYSNSIETRNLSSHNTYLEVLLRMGLLGLLVYVSIFYKLLLFTRGSDVTNEFGRFLFSYIFAFLLFSSSNEFGVTQIFVGNCFLWIVIGYFLRKAGEKGHLLAEE